jgi:hypothetical protein
MSETGVPHETHGSYGESRYCLFSTVKGLTSEVTRFLDIYHKVVPDVLALPISSSELKALRRYRGESVEMTTPERIYAKNLSRFGEVKIPHPVYVDCVERARDDVIPVCPLDLDDVAFSECYARFITGMEMVSASVREKILNGREFKSTDPFEFAIEWDRAINSSKGYRKLEDCREAYMSEAIVKLLRKHHVLLAVIEHERSHGIIRRIASMTPASKPKAR